MSESECLIKFRKLRQLQDVEISDLANQMGTIACDLYDSGDYSAAESWYRRIVTAKQRIKWHKPEQTLWACVQIPNCVLHQGRYSEVQQLHKDLHTKIERILDSDHPILILSQLLKGHILQNLGHRAEADAAYRQVLQICLSSLGLHHPATLLALQSLGLSLIRLRMDAETQGLFETTICVTKVRSHNYFCLLWFIYLLHFTISRDTPPRGLALIFESSSLFITLYVLYLTAQSS
jgi:tetratricopeptide (TPR) repeat protein